METMNGKIGDSNGQFSDGSSHFGDAMVVSPLSFPLYQTEYEPQFLSFSQSIATGEFNHLSHD